MSSSLLTMAQKMGAETESFSDSKHRITEIVA